MKFLLTPPALTLIYNEPLTAANKASNRVCIANLRKLELFPRWLSMNRWFSFLLVCFACRAAPVVIGTNTQLSLPTGGEYGMFIANRPASNAVETLNPPLFSWQAKNNWEAGLDSGVQIYVREYRFRLSKNSDLSTALVDVRTRGNAYNFIAPITNVDGSTYTSPVYWRVDYFLPDNLSTPESTLNNQFTLTSGAVQWSRSQFATDAGITNGWHHPMLFGSNNMHIISNAIVPGNNQYFVGATNVGWSTVNATNWTNAYRFQTSTNSSFDNVRDTFDAITNWVHLKITNETIYYRWHYYAGGGTSSWTSASSLVAGSETNKLVAAPPSAEDYQMTIARYQNTAFSRLMTRLPVYDPVTNEAVKMSQYWRAAGLGVADWSVYSVPVSFAYMIDWTYADLNAAQKQLIIEMADSAFLPLASTIGSEVGSTTMTLAEQLDPTRSFESHYLTHYTRIFYLLGQFSAESTNCLKFTKWWLNHFASSTPWGNEENLAAGGRSYTFNYVGHNGRIFRNLWHASQIWPSVQWSNNPSLLTIGDWLTRANPPQFSFRADVFGDGRAFPSFGYLEPDWIYEDVGWWLGVLTRNSEFWQTYLLSAGATAWNGTYYIGNWSDPNGCDAMVQRACIQGLYSEPGRTTNQTLVKLFPKGGYVMGGSTNSNISELFTNGVSFRFWARPSGRSGSPHSWFGDGVLDIDAYGANVTDQGEEGGAGSFLAYGRSSESKDTMLINGYGQHQPFQYPQVPNYGRITAYSNSPDGSFTYIESDLTECYQRRATTETSGATYYPGWPYGTLSYLQSYKRQVLFMRGKYFVVRDKVDCSQSTTNTLLFHIRPWVKFDANAFTWNYTNTSYTSGSNVAIWVQHIATNAMSLVVYSNTTARTNALLGTDWSGGAAATRTNTVWVTKVGSTNTFIHVIFPQRGTDSAPTLTTVAEDTARIQQGSIDDVISFNRANTSPDSTFIVNTSIGGASTVSRTISGATIRAGKF